MINILVGLQGAGKTYFAVYEIWKHIKKMHQAEISGIDYKYTKIYTNIEGFIPNKYVETIDMARLYEIWRWELEQYKAYEARMGYESPPNIDFTPKPIQNKQQALLPCLNMEVEESRLSEPTVDDVEIFENDDIKLLESMKDPDAKLDPEFIQYTMPHFEEQGFVHCLFVIDEAHNFFGGFGLKPAYKRLISYHRHYHNQDYLLITQEPKMLNAAVTQLTAFTIKAANPIMRFRSDLFTYKVYSGGYISFSGDNKLETKTLKAKDLVFSLYNSGGKKLAKSFFTGIIIKLAIGLLLVMAYGYYSLTSFGERQIPVKVVQKDINTTASELKKVVPVKPIEHEIKKSTEIFLIVGNSIIHKKTATKFMLNDFLSLIDPKEDYYLSRSKNLDGTVTTYYKLTDSTLEILK